jgi:hypothetical protein
MLLSLQPLRPPLKQPPTHLDHHQVPETQAPRQTPQTSFSELEGTRRTDVGQQGCYTGFLRLTRLYRTSIHLCTLQSSNCLPACIQQPLHRCTRAGFFACGPGQNILHLKEARGYCLCQCYLAGSAMDFLMVINFVRRKASLLGRRASKRAVQSHRRRGGGRAEGKRRSFWIRGESSS